MDNTTTCSDFIGIVECCVAVYENSIYRLVDFGYTNANGYSSFSAISIGYLVFELELVTYTVQCFANHLVALAQILGIAIRSSISGLVPSNAICTTYVSGCNTYRTYFCMDDRPAQTIEYPPALDREVWSKL